MPAYFFDPYRYRAHKMQGGTFQSFNEKKYLPLTDAELIRHLKGDQYIGIYPLLIDNCSWFIVADFDEKKWLDDCLHFVAFLSSKGISGYTERSRSGNGGHVWIFFEQKYPAEKSRKFLLALLAESGLVSAFDKGASFDRLFPNQDYLSGKGLGNLIALPLNGKAVIDDNASFLDPQSGIPYTNQWNFLSQIKRVPISELDRLSQSVLSAQIKLNSEVSDNLRELRIMLDGCVRIEQSYIPRELAEFLKEELNVPNPEYYVKQNSGRSVFGTERFYKFIQEENGSLVIPRGFAGKLLRFCKTQEIPYNFSDKRFKGRPIAFTFQGGLRDFQHPAVSAAGKKDMGIIVAPPGAGKTVVALKIIADKQQPALIIVHRKQLADQWVERVESFLGISKADIGKIVQGKVRLGKQVTIATIQSLKKAFEAGDRDGIKSVFGTIIVDECHHLPALTYQKVVQQLNSFYLYGLTATPFRKYTDGKLLFIHLGEVISEIIPFEFSGSRLSRIIIRDTELDIPFNPKTDRFETLSKMLAHDVTRNRQIADDVLKEVGTGRKIIILTERKEHIDSLQQLLKSFAEIITLSGDDAESSRKAKWNLLKAGEYQILITTGQFFGEGSDLSNASCLFLVYPFTFEGKLIQYIGRVQRSEIPAVVYDYRDIKIPYLDRMFLKRNVYYRKIEKQIDLFSDPDETSNIAPPTLVLEQKIALPIDALEFIYGGVIFNYHVDLFKMDLVFEVSNEDLRPEFGVLKPYFSKMLKSKTVSVFVHAAIQNGKLLSQSADSADIGIINRRMIEAMRFQFVSKRIGSRAFGNSELVTDPEFSMQTDHPLYESGQDLLNDILSKGLYKHSQELRYLAERHASHILKVRYLLHPFSFVFLLEGERMYHICLETLDTEEATYLWSFAKLRLELPNYLRHIEVYVDAIQKSGRQIYLNSVPLNFSRIVHDYSDRKKGFIKWKDELEERIF